MRIGLIGVTGYTASIIVIVTLLLQLTNFFIPESLIFVFIIISVAYLVSIVLRGAFWLKLGLQTNHKYFKSLSILIITLGITASALVTYLVYENYQAFTFLPMFESIFLKGAISLWVIYTAAEAVGYLSYAHFFSIRIGYLGMMSLPAAALLVYQLFISEPAGFLTHPQSPVLFASMLMLLGSAATISYASFIVKIDVAVKKQEKEELDELEMLLGGRASLSRGAETGKTIVNQARISRGPATDQVYLPRPTFVQAAQTTMIVVDVVSRSSEALCPNCGSSVPLGTNSCPSCGSHLYEPRPGLKCPVCGAPLSYSRRVASNHRVCGICFSDLRLRQSRMQ